MKYSLAIVALLGVASARVAKRSYSQVGGICFDFGDCLIFGSGLVPCDRSGNNGMLFGLLGTCTDGKTAAAPASSSGGFLASLGLGKRHGPDDDEASEVIEVAANATVAAPAMAAMAGM